MCESYILFPLFLCNCGTDQHNWFISIRRWNCRGRCTDVAATPEASCALLQAFKAFANRTLLGRYLTFLNSITAAFLNKLNSRKVVKAGIKLVLKFTRLRHADATLRLRCAANLDRANMIFFQSKADHNYRFHISSQTSWQCFVCIRGKSVQALFGHMNHKLVLRPAYSSYGFNWFDHH